jgi:hypothetical protein
MREIVITTSELGETSVEIQGVKGPSCSKILDLLRLQTEEVQNTAEYYAPEEQVITLKST